MTDTVMPKMPKQSDERASHEDQSKLGKLTTAFGVSLGGTSVFSAFLVILKETHQDSVLALMRAATGHHWVTHGLLDLLVFILIGVALQGFTERLRSRTGLVTVISLGGVVFGALIVASFYYLD